MGGITLIYCLVIIIFGILLFFYLLYSKRSFSSILQRIKKEVKKDEVVSGQMLDAVGNINTGTFRFSSYDAEKIEELKEEYEKTYSLYAAFSQLIPLFSSAGLLGTVLGLILGSKSGIQMDELLGSLGLAMWTTFSGLICTIVLKITDSIGPGRIVSAVDAALTRLDNQLDLEMYKMAGKNVNNN